MIDLDKLDALAKEATKGPRKADGWGIYAKAAEVKDGNAAGCLCIFVVHPNDAWQTVRDVEFTAACDPDTILALIAALREARGEIERLTEREKVFVKALEEIACWPSRKLHQVQQKARFWLSAKDVDTSEVFNRAEAAEAKLARAEKVIEQFMDANLGPLEMAAKYGPDVGPDDLLDRAIFSAANYDKDKP